MLVFSFFGKTLSCLLLSQSVVDTDSVPWEKSWAKPMWLGGRCLELWFSVDIEVSERGQNVGLNMEGGCGSASSGYCCGLAGLYKTMRDQLMNMYLHDFIAPATILALFLGAYNFPL